LQWISGLFGRFFDGGKFMAWRLISLQHCNTSPSVHVTSGEIVKLDLEDTPALYFLAEVKAPQAVPASELREIHKAKLAYGAVRIGQDG
jgi:hypothetical protein